MPKYRLTPAAKSDLIEIWNYTVDTWGEKQTEKYLQDMEDKLNQLAETPEIGQQRSEIRPGYFLTSLCLTGIVLRIFSV
jgi:toxin ParE1/3/4